MSRMVVKFKRQVFIQENNTIGGCKIEVMLENRLLLSNTNQPVQSHQKARSCKFRIKVEEGLYYLSSKNKGADQLCSNYTADLHLCFRIGKKPAISRRGSCYHHSLSLSLHIAEIKVHISAVKNNILTAFHDMMQNKL